MAAVADRVPASATPAPKDHLNPGKIPYIVIVIDELADLMQTVSVDVESAIARITQMGLRGGGHLIVATP
jgi:S-DNA-T family DNA segregation ATPase FtsK/SpoIIIE